MANKFCLVIFQPRHAGSQRSLEAATAILKDGILTSRAGLVRNLSMEAVRDMTTDLSLLVYVKKFAVDTRVCSCIFHATYS